MGRMLLRCATYVLLVTLASCRSLPEDASSLEATARALRAAVRGAYGVATRTDGIRVQACPSTRPSELIVSRSELARALGEAVDPRFESLELTPDGTKVAADIGVVAAIGDRASAWKEAPRAPESTKSVDEVREAVRALGQFETLTIYTASTREGGCSRCEVELDAQVIEARAVTFDLVTGTPRCERGVKLKESSANMKDSPGDVNQRIREKLAAGPPSQSPASSFK